MPPMRPSPLLLLLLLLAAPLTAQAAPPLVIELYTSQGCSSCPPADALLGELSRTDPDLLPLGLHVTYWDRLGWKDPYSLQAVTQRQQATSARLGLDTVYTPQLMVDGHIDAIGSDPAAVRKAIAKARTERGPQVPLTLTQQGDTLHIHADAGAGSGTLLLVGFDRQHTTPVRGGENGGRTLSEVNVVRALTPIAPWPGTALDLTVPRPQGDRAAILLQAADGHMLGAATLP